jgi:hypothetical protein
MIRPGGVGSPLAGDGFPHEIPRKRDSYKMNKHSLSPTSSYRSNLNS